MGGTSGQTVTTGQVGGDAGGEKGGGGEEAEGGGGVDHSWQEFEEVRCLGVISMGLVDEREISRRASIYNSIQVVVVDDDEDG